MSCLEINEFEDEIVALGLEVHKLLHSLLQKARILASAGQVKRLSDEAAVSDQARLEGYVAVGQKYIHWIRLCIRDYYSTDLDDPFLKSLVRFLYRLQNRLKQLT